MSAAQHLADAVGNGESPKKFFLRTIGAMREVEYAFGIAIGMIPEELIAELAE